MCYPDVRKHRLERLTSESGETLTETLVSILITSLALLLLATAIGTAVRIVTRSKSRMSEYYLHESNLIGGESTGTVILTFEVPIELESGTGNLSVKTHSDDLTGIVYYERNDEHAG